jgi:tetratricopeptide (TPR) repeat protein
MQILPTSRPRSLSLLALVLGGSLAWSSVSFAADAPNPAMPGVRKRREPPPAVIPTQEVQAAQKKYDARDYQGAVVQAKAALNKNERYTPAMLVMAKAYFKLGKHEWVKTLGDMMKNAGASEAERSDIYQMLAFMEVEKKNTPGAIELFRKAAEARPDNAILWNNLGAQYLVAKNYREAGPVLEKAVQLQPTFAKAHLNLGSAYRGVKMFDKALAEYKRALALFPRYADAVFNLGILYLDAEKMPNMDTTAKLNTAISYFEQYKKMVTGAGQSVPPEADAYVAEAQENIKKEQKRIERQKKQEERDRQRATQKAAADAKKPPPTPAAPGSVAPAGYPPAPGPVPPRASTPAPAGYPAAPAVGYPRAPAPAPAGYPAAPAPAGYPAAPARSTPTPAPAGYPAAPAGYPAAPAGYPAAPAQTRKP